MRAVPLLLGDERTDGVSKARILSRRGVLVSAADESPAIRSFAELELAYRAGDCFHLHGSEVIIVLPREGGRVDAVLPEDFQPKSRSGMAHELLYNTKYS